MSLIDESEGFFYFGGSIIDEYWEYDEYELNVEVDLDDICSVVKSDEEDEENIEDED